MVGRANLVRCVEALAQLQFDMLRGERDPLDMVFDQLPLIVGKRLRLGAARLQMIAERRNDERLDLGGRHAADRSGRLGLLLQHGLADVVAVAGTSLVGVARPHPHRQYASPRSEAPAPYTPSV